MIVPVNYNRSFADGLFLPVQCEVLFAHQMFTNWPVQAVIERVELSAGSAPGVAFVHFPKVASDNMLAPLKANSTSSTVAHIGDRATIKAGGKTIFRGILLTTPVTVATDQDVIELMLVEEKWLLGAKVLGQVGIGTLDSGNKGFTDVGFEMIFNKDGKPNKNPSAYDFSKGSTAVFWTLRDVLQLVFDRYVDATVATLPAAQVTHAAWDTVPADLSVVGQTVPQVIDALCELAGETWTLIPGADSATYRSVRRNNGTVRNIRLFRPWGEAQANAATEEHANDIKVEVSIANAKDRFHVHSAPIVVERVHTNTGSNPILARKTSFADKEYQARYAVDVTKYGENNLGYDLSAGAKPKPWLTDLVTRMTSDSSSYVTAAQIASTPALAWNKRAEIPVWVASDGVLANAVLCLSGYRIDADNATVDFKAKLKVLPATGSDPESLEISDWSTFGCWLTTATVLEYPETYQTEEASAYLETRINQLIQRNDLVPERRRDAWLPDLAGGNNAISKLSVGAEEEYIDITSKLESTGDNALAETPVVETPITARMPFFPLWDVGDKVAIVGRNVGASGDEVITRISFDVHEQFVTVLEATNVMRSVNQAQLVGVRK